MEHSILFFFTINTIYLRSYLFDFIISDCIASLLSASSPIHSCLLIQFNLDTVWLQCFNMFSKIKAIRSSNCDHLKSDRNYHYSSLQQNTSVHAYDGCIVMYTNVHTRTQATQIRDSCYVVPIRSRSDRGFYLDIIWTYSRTISRDRSRYLKYIHRNRIVSKLNKLHSHVSTRITSYMYLSSELFWISMIH